MRSFCAGLLLLVLAVPVLTGCGIVEPDRSSTLTLQVGPQTVDCVGFVPQQCLLVKEPKSTEWTYFYDAIEGFTFEPGYTYVLLVRRLQIRNPPQDGSSAEYHLLKVLSKEPAPAA
ncbi:MAG TPA: DUF4377 domain-containing protein [Longimicrobiaceae bacterium]|nr:DUF4377 domain-containing protein [Longimicrobiaceae bacterium]